MTTITIPKEITKGEELVVISRGEYNEYIRWRKAVATHRTFKPTKAVLRDLEEAREEYRHGKTMTLHELKQELEIRS